MTIYSFADLTGAFIHPLVGQYILGGGNVGLGQITVENTQDHTAMDVSADGTVMMSHIPGDQGQVTIEMQQTSDLYGFLLGWYNACNAAAKTGGGVAMWAAASISLRNIVDGSNHTAIGVAPGKNPPKNYQATGQKISWVMPCAKLTSE